MLYTTLNKIKACSPCEDGWRKLLNHLGKTEADDEALSFITILESNGIEDAMWSLRTCEDERAVRLFACDCAESVLHFFEKEYPNDNRPRKAIEVARKYADGDATLQELDEACVAACAASRCAEDAEWYAVRDAAWYAARAAAWSAERDAGDAAYAAYAVAGYAWGAEDKREKQTELFKKYFG